MTWILAHWRQLLAVALIAAAFRAGVVWEQRAQAARDLDQANADRDRRTLTFSIEGKRLEIEADADLALGVIADEARADPDAGLPALGLRAAQRLNRIP